MTLNKNVRSSILLVDDNPDFLESYSLILKKKKFRVFSATNEKLVKS